MTRDGEIGIGIWGAGWVSQGHLNAYLQTPGCKVVAIGSRRRESAEKLAAWKGLRCRLYDDYSTFLADPELDAVSICTPHALHPQNAIEGARAGKHLFIEKPVAMRLEDLAAMRKAIREAGVVTEVGFVTRGTPLAQHLRRMVKNGELGRIFMVDVDYWHARRGRPAAYRKKETVGSAYLVGGVHALDVGRFITGLDVVEVCAASTQVSAAEEEGYDYPCVDAILVKYSNGAVGRVSAVIHGHLPYQLNIDILGDGGIARNNRIYTLEHQEGAGFETLSVAGPASGDVLDHAFPYLMNEFVQGIRSGRQTETSLEDAANTHEVGFAAEISKQRGGWVKLPL